MTDNEKSRLLGLLEKFCKEQKNLGRCEEDCAYCPITEAIEMVEADDDDSDIDDDDEEEKEEENEDDY